MSVVIVIGDTHEPFVHPMYRRFCLDIAEKYKASRVVHIGDVVDQHSAAPNYDSDPNGRSTGDEMEEALKGVAAWHKSFPDARVCIGNHDKRHILAARKAGLNDRYLRDYAEVWGTPSWKWALSHEIDGVLYEHGTGTSGDSAALKRAVSNRQSTVIGHTHTGAGITYQANKRSLIFGLNVGCGIDVDAYAFEYGVDLVKRPILGCGLVFNAEMALFVPMPCAPGQRYHRSRA